MTRPSASGWPRRSSSGSRPETPRATSTMPQRHGRPKLSDTITATSVPKRASEGGADPVGRRVGIARQEGDDVARPGTDVRGVDAAVRAHEAVLGLGDQDAVLACARSAAPRAGRPRSGAHRGPTRRPTRSPRAAARRSAGRPPRPRPSTRPSGSRPGRRPSRSGRTSAGCLERVADHRGEVVAVADLGQARQREDLDPAGAVSRQRRHRRARGQRPPPRRGAGRRACPRRARGHPAPRRRPRPPTTRATRGPTGC